MTSYEVPLFDLAYDEAEERAVLDVLRSRWISMGPRTRELEERFAAMLGTRHAVAVSSGTAALHLAVLALGIGPGDEVIVPSLTFVATVNCVRYVGARPVFADVCGPHDLSIDPYDVESVVTPHTRAIICMHYGGFACDMDALTATTERHGIRLIEDAAHAPASSHAGRPLGSIGDVGCFSFYANKNVSCGEGGLLATDDDDVAERCRLLRSHGMTTLSYDRARGHALSYDVLGTGFNYRLDDLRAALALAQLDKLEADVAARRALRQAYLEQLSEIDDIWIPYAESAHPSSEYVFPVVLRSGGSGRRADVRRRMAADGVQTSVHYPAAHRFTALEAFARPLPRTEFATDHEITLPMHASLGTEAVRHVARTLERALETP